MERLPEPGEIWSLLPDRVAAAHDRTVLASVVARASELARAQTGGRGFSVDGTRADPEVVAVIRSGVLRALTNPEMSLASAAPLFGGTPGTFCDWTMVELATLTRLRNEMS